MVPIALADPLGRHDDARPDPVRPAHLRGGRQPRGRPARGHQRRPGADRGLHHLLDARRASPACSRSARSASSQSSTGRDIVLFGVGAAVVGGVSLFGGRGRLVQATVGALLISMITNGLGLLGYSAGITFLRHRRRARSSPRRSTRSPGDAPDRAHWPDSAGLRPVAGPRCGCASRRRPQLADAETSRCRGDPQPRPAPASTPTRRSSGSAQDYYLATSTMVWQPGIRLFHSTRPGQLDTGRPRAWRRRARAAGPGDPTQGIWAPSLTYDPADAAVLPGLLAGAQHDGALLRRRQLRGHRTGHRAARGARRPTSTASASTRRFFHDDDGRHWVVTLEWDPRDGYEHPGRHRARGVRRRSRRRLVGPSTAHLPRRHRPRLPGGPAPVPAGTATTT